ncbi:hypothetical protein G6011_09099 [Alternaria panax]|uniref:Ubiquitin-like domain-containing protein n=1 Tax=Alternaria panax TaxID=48097 RepID=A0AAD4IAG6_9PLEO|nr:hypothetical protein G6011_09099 [Alternaria panax]
MESQAEDQEAAQHHFGQNEVETKGQDGTETRPERLTSQSDMSDQSRNNQETVDFLRTARRSEDDEERVAPASARRSDYLRQPRPINTRKSDMEKSEVVYLCDHEGARYIFPFDRLPSYKASKELWKEVYMNNLSQSYGERQRYIDDIVAGNYRMQTIDGATILPSAWNAIVIPDSTYQIKFDNHSPTYPPPPSSRSWSSSRSSLLNASQVDHRDDSEAGGAVTLEVLRPVSPTQASESATTTEDDSAGSYTSESDDASTKSLDSRPQPRDVVAPVDSEGNKLSFQVKTKQPAHLVMPHNGSGSQEEIKGMTSGNKDVADSKVETRRITKVLMIETEGRNKLQIYTLPGPENNLLQASVATTWYHISAAQVDFDRYRNVCLGIPSLSGRLQVLTREMLRKLQKEKIRPFLGGRFIEPGTVLRADESDQTDPQSVIFSCLPYFGLGQAKEKPSGLNHPLFPPRTLMESFYPYEPVRERDGEQSYRKFGNNHSHKIIHVPTLWIMNIGSSVVVTCGHQSLSEVMGRSINSVEVNVKQLGKQDMMKNELTDVYITSLDGRRFVFPISSCKSYFQLEAKALELNYTTGDRLLDRDIKLELQTRDGSARIGPGDWKKILTRAADLIRIDIRVSSDQDDPRPGEDASNSKQATAAFSTLVPPFFHWLPSKTNDQLKSDTKFEATSRLEPQGSAACLEQVDKAMTSRTLTHRYNPIEYAFASTDYYKALPEAKYSDVCTKQNELDVRAKRARQPVSGITFHQAVVRTQIVGILERSVELFDAVRATLKLFENDLDCSAILRKVWGALENIYKYVISIERRGSFEPGHKSYSDPEWEHPDLVGRSWFIRTSANPCSVSLPDADDRVKKSTHQCKRCRGMKSFDKPQAALDHVERHATMSSDVTQAGAVPKQENFSRNIPIHTRPCDWVINDAQHKREHTNAGALSILNQACTTTKGLLNQARDLAEGVQEEDGRISARYSMPHEFIEAFRKMVVFYLANERALFEIGEIYERDAPFLEDLNGLTYSETGLEVLARFGKDAQRSLRFTRLALCKMARPGSPLEISKHLSLGPEFLCAWLMRRLLVKPLERSKTVGDMFREYVSRIQFEVNDRPSKRLLRTINLIQEELQVLISVNTWQTNLVQNYLSVLDDSTYGTDMPFRRGMFPYERTLVDACLDHLSLAREDYLDLIRRCGPLSDRTKQIIEINEEDHGKAIMVFTVVTVIFLPLSFVTSYFGMNTADIRDMNQEQSLFWSVAIPLTFVTVGSCLLIGYNGEDIRHSMASFYHKALGRDQNATEAGGISVPQRKRPLDFQNGSSSITESLNGTAEAEFASPLSEISTGAHHLEAGSEWYSSRYELSPRWHTSYDRTYVPQVPTQSYAEPISISPLEEKLLVVQACPRIKAQDHTNVYQERGNPTIRERSRFDETYADPRERSRPNEYYAMQARHNYHGLPSGFQPSCIPPPPLPSAQRVATHNAATTSNRRLYEEVKQTKDHGDAYLWVKKSRHRRRGNGRLTRRASSVGTDE